jgi:ribosomal protein S8
MMELNYLPFVEYSNVDTLLSKCSYTIAQNFTKLDKSSFSTLPNNLKQKLLKVLSKRGHINDENIRFFLNAETKILDLTDCQQISDKALEKLDSCKNLREIYLTSNIGPRLGVTNKGILSLIKNCPHLRVILLDKCVQIDDLAISELAKAYGLRLIYLNISNCSLISDNALNTIGTHCKSLKAINMNNTHITDTGIFNLLNANVSNTIEEIHVSNCKLITDESIECILIKTKCLKNLLFHSCPKITGIYKLIESYLLKIARFFLTCLSLQLLVGRIKLKGYLF